MVEFGLLDHIPLGSFVLRSDFIVQFWNRTLEGWTGISKNEIVNNNIYTFFPQSQRKKILLSTKEYFHWWSASNFFISISPTFYSSKNAGRILAYFPNDCYCNRSIGQARILCTFFSARYDGSDTQNSELSENARSSALRGE